MRKNKAFVLDTNVLVHDPEAFKKFPNCHVVIPLTVVEELDSLKKNPGEVGKGARHAIRGLDEVRSHQSGNLHEGVGLDNGSEVSVEVCKQFDHELFADSNDQDNWIVLTAYFLRTRFDSVVFVSKDLAARVKARAFGIETEDYENFKVSFETLYSGWNELEVDSKTIDLIRKDGELNWESISNTAFKSGMEKRNPYANEFFGLSHVDAGSLTVRYDSRSGALKDLEALPKDIWGLKPLNIQQRMALDLLLDDRVNLVTLVGMAGTGKTLLALAAGLRKVFDESKYSKILVSRPIVPLGKDIGFLPGTKDEKLFHWMQPIYDNLEILCRTDSEKGKDVHKWVLDSHRIEMEAVTYIRGRSLPNVYLIVDEAQNLTPHEVKTIISRAGKGTKVVLTGDPTQIDNPYLDRDFNAVTYTIGRFKDQPLFGHVRLSSSERSELAALAAKIM